MGSKNKVAKRLLPIILKNRKPGQVYIEPFCGGCNMIDKVSGPRWANDNNHYLIALFRALQGGWVPPDIVSAELYKDIRTHKDSYPPELVAFVGFTCSFGSKWWGGYAQNAAGRNYALESKTNLLKQLPNIRDVVFTNMCYKDMVITEPAVIYCDPPYFNTVKYVGDFNHSVFWEWVRVKSLEGHNVYVSEYVAPDDFECLVEIPHFTRMNKNKMAARIEKLFVYGGD